MKRKIDYIASSFISSGIQKSYDNTYICKKVKNEDEFTIPYPNPQFSNINYQVQMDFPSPLFSFRKSEIYLHEITNTDTLLKCYNNIDYAQWINWYKELNLNEIEDCFISNSYFSMYVDYYDKQSTYHIILNKYKQQTIEWWYQDNKIIGTTKCDQCTHYIHTVKLNSLENIIFEINKILGDSSSVLVIHQLPDFLYGKLTLKSNQNVKIRDLSKFPLNGARNSLLDSLNKVIDPIPFSRNTEGITNQIAKRCKVNTQLIRIDKPNLQIYIRTVEFPYSENFKYIGQGIDKSPITALSKAYDDLLRSIYSNFSIYLDETKISSFIRCLESTILSDHTDFMLYIYFKWHYYWEIALYKFNTFKQNKLDNDDHFNIRAEIFNTYFNPHILELHKPDDTCFLEIMELYGRIAKNIQNLDNNLVYQLNKKIKSFYESASQKSYFHSEKPIIVFDLDLTLIQSFSMNGDNADIQKIYTSYPGVKHAIVGDSETYFKIRPDAYLFLQSLSKYFTLVLYTNGEEKYVKEILKTLDPQNKLFENRCITWIDDGDKNIPATNNNNNNDPEKTTIANNGINLCIPNQEAKVDIRKVKHLKNILPFFGTNQTQMLFCRCLILDDQQDAWDPLFSKSIIRVEKYIFKSPKPTTRNSLNYFEMRESIYFFCLYRKIIQIYQNYCHYYGEYFNDPRRDTISDIGFLVSSYNQKLFQGCTILLTGIIAQGDTVRMKYFRSLITNRGGKFIMYYHRSITHVIAKNLLTHKAKEGQRENKFIVTEQWLHDCINYNVILPEAVYKVE